MIVVYVAGPYRAPTQKMVLQNIARARDVAAELWRMGFAVVCPHSNSALMDGVCPDDHFLNAYLEILKRCDLVVTCPGWSLSRGALGEVELALKSGIPVFDWPAQRDELEALAKEGA